jgi:hypothetical protein
MTSTKKPHLRQLDEEEAITAVVDAVRELFPLVTQSQSRELARRVLRTLASRGISLAAKPQQDASE